MYTFLRILTKVFDVILWPFKGLPDFWGLTFIAIIIGFIAVLLFKYVSNQKKLKTIMNNIKMRFSEIILYRDDMRQILKAQKEILKQNILYFLNTIKPAIPIVIVVLLTLSQINLRYSIQPIAPGEPITIKVTAAKTSDLEFQEIGMILPKGFEILTPAFHDPGGNEVQWKIRAHEPGEYLLGFQTKYSDPENLDMETEDPFQIDIDVFHVIKKRIIIGQIKIPFAPHLGKKGFIETFFNPIEGLIPYYMPIEAIDIEYKSNAFKLGPFDLNIHWLVAFLLIAIGFGLVFRKLMKIS